MSARSSRPSRGGAGGSPAGRQVEVVIERLAPGGDGVGHEVGPLGSPTLGRAVFVPETAPRDRLVVTLTREKGRVAWGEIAVLSEPSPLRVAPGCDVFPTCGGCQWRHVEGAVQREAKRAIVSRALGNAEVELRTPSPLDGYRERARLHGTREGALAFSARRSHALVTVRECPQLSPRLSAVLGAVASWKGDLRRLVADTTWDLQAGQEGVHVALTRPARSRTDEAADAARVLEALAGAGVVGVRCGAAVAGASDVDVSEPGGPPLRLPAGAFAQVSAASHAALVDAVLAGVGPTPGRVLELYAGSGNFTRHLLRVADQVLASDGDAAAVARGRVNAPGARWSVPPPPDARPDTVVLDPPRAGADGPHLAAAEQAGRRIVYVSCDPQTLGRDAAALRQAGFVLQKVTAFDLMPQTFHVETVAVFDRVAAPPDAPI